jgi:hypothetical protein
MNALNIFQMGHAIGYLLFMLEVTIMDAVYYQHLLMKRRKNLNGLLMFITTISLNSMAERWLSLLSWDIIMQKVKNIMYQIFVMLLNLKITFMIIFVMLHKVN